MLDVSPYIELQFVADTAMSSRDIEWWGGGEYSHVDIVWPDGRLYGARSNTAKVAGVKYGRGVQFRPAAYIGNAKVRRIRIPCSFEQRNRGLQWAIGQAGKPYDWLAIIAYAFARNWRTEGAWYCSELVTRFLEVAFNFDLPITPNKITPGTAACVAGAIALVPPLAGAWE